VNLLQFEVAVSNETGLSATDEKQEIDDALNVAVQRVLEDTHCFVKRVDYTGFDGTSVDYTLDSTILEIEEIYLTSGGTRYALERVSVPGLIEKRRVGLPGGSPTSHYAVTGANLMMFWPAPGANDTLTVYEVPTPTALSGPTDDPSSTSPTNFGGIPQILHEAIFFYACSRAASYDDDQTSAQGQRYRDWYDKEIVRYRTILRKKGGDRNARAVVNDKRRRRPFHTNDVYPRF
jgi:hypothetical protein